MQRGIFDAFGDAVMSPLFLGGAALLGGEGIGGAINGFQAGGNFAAQKQKQVEQQRQRQAFDELAKSGTFGGVPREIMSLAQAAGPDAGIDLLAKSYQAQQGYGQQERMARLNHELSLKRQQEGGGEYGKAGTIVQDPKTGSFYSVQYGSRGEPKVTPLNMGGTALQPSRGVDTVGDTIIDKATGQAVRNVGQNIAGSEEAKVIGRETGEKRMALPKLQTTIQMQDISDRVVIEDIDRALKLSESPWATGFVGSLSNYIANTPGSNLSQMLKSVEANIGFDKLQDMRANSPTGGALGAVTERELTLLQSVWGSIVNSQSAEQLQQNLRRLAEVRREFSQIRRQAFERDMQTFGGAQGTAVQQMPQGGSDGWVDVGGVRVREKR